MGNTLKKSDHASTFKIDIKRTVTCCTESKKIIDEYRKQISSNNNNIKKIDFK